MPEEGAGGARGSYSSSPLTRPPLQLSSSPGSLAPGSKAPLSLHIASFSGPQDLDLRTSVNPRFPLTFNLSRYNPRTLLLSSGPPFGPSCTPSHGGLVL